MIWYVFPIVEGVSWEGHTAGLITGLIFALIFRKEIAKPKKFDWEQEDYKVDNDPFLKHFDENGNFMELPENEIELEVKIENESENITKNLNAEKPMIHYTFKPNKRKEE
jgi:hypothetical protein